MPLRALFDSYLSGGTAAYTAAARPVLMPLRALFDSYAYVIAGLVVPSKLAVLMPLRALFDSYTLKYMIEGDNTVVTVS